MPNWTYNDLQVQDGTGGYELSKCDKPEQKARKQLIKFHKENINVDKERAFSFQTAIPRPKDLDITSPAHTDEEKAQEKINLKKYGYKNWYDWNCDKWGTKWDTARAQIDEAIEHEGEVRIYFETAWAPPLAWLKEISKKYPLLTFKMHVSEESEAFIGKPIARNGNLKQNITGIDYPEG